MEEVLGRRRYERREGVDTPPGYRNGFGKPAPAQSHERDDHGAAAAGAGAGGALRESAAAVVQAANGGSGPALARAVPARAGGTGTSIWRCEGCWGRRAAVGGIDRAAEGQLAGGVRDVEAPAAGRPGARVRLGRRHLRQAGLEKDKAAMLVLIAALRDGRKVILAVESGYRESTESWAALLRDSRRAGLRAPRLVIADGHLGIWGAVAAVSRRSNEQRCWNHRIVNVLDTLPPEAAERGARPC